MVGKSVLDVIVENVELVDARERAIQRMTPTGVVAGGREFELDCIVFATGFDAMTGAVLGIDIRGRAGITLKEKWDAGPRTYLGLCSVGFPNLFLITGPGSPSVLTNMIVAIEQHVNWITDCLDDMRREGRATIEATEQAQDDWVDHVNAVAGMTLYPTCNSWYLGKNIPVKPQVFMPFDRVSALRREVCTGRGERLPRFRSRLKPRNAGCRSAAFESRPCRERLTPAP